MADQTENQKKEPEKDSLGMDVKKSPWLIFALLQIPIVILMVIFIYIMSQQGNN
jgi:hypothetical protein